MKMRLIKVQGRAHALKGDRRPGVRAGLSFKRARRLIEYGCDNRGSRGPRASGNRIRMYAVGFDLTIHCEQTCVGNPTGSHFWS